MAKLWVLPVFTEVNLEVLKGSIGLLIVKKLFGSWNEVELLIIGKNISTSGFSDVIFEVLKSPIVVGVVEKMIRIWNQVEMLIRGEVITTSGFYGRHFRRPKQS